MREAGERGVGKSGALGGRTGLDGGVTVGERSGGVGGRDKAAQSRDRQGRAGWNGVWVGGVWRVALADRLRIELA